MVWLDLWIMSPRPSCHLSPYARSTGQQTKLGFLHVQHWTSVCTLALQPNWKQCDGQNSLYPRK